MSARQPLPPTYFWGAVLLMVGLHFLCPIRRLIALPYGLIGVAPMLVGLLANIFCSNAFNRRKTTVKPFEQSSHLVTNGLYRFSRHPMYAGMVLVLVGLAVLLGSITPAVVIPAFVLVIKKTFVDAEETALEETFGDAYLEYKHRVKRWI